MDDSKALQAILDKLDGMEKGQRATNERIDRLDAKIAALQEDVSEIKEDAAATRGAANTLLDWAEKAQVQVQIPLFPKERD